MAAIPIAPHGDATVGARMVEFRKIQIPAGRLHPGRHHGNLRSRRKCVHEGGRAAAQSEAPDVGGELQAVRGRRRLRDHVDHGEHGPAAVQCGARPAHDLDAVDHLEADTERGLDERRVVEVLVQHVAIEHEQKAVVVVRRPAEPAGTEIEVVAVVAAIEPAQLREDVRDRAVSVAEELIAGDDAHRGGRIRRELLILRGGVDRNAEQRVQR